MGWCGQFRDHTLAHPLQPVAQSTVEKVADCQSPFLLDLGNGTSVAAARLAASLLT